MSTLLQWAFGLCAAMAALGLCRMLIPGSGMEKTFRLVVSIFFLATLLSPAVLRFPGLMLELPMHTQAEIEERATRLNEMAHSQALDIASRRLRQLTYEKLSARGIIAHYIAINFTTGQQGEILLESIEVTLDEIHRENERPLIDYLQGQLGSIVWLHYATQSAA